MDEPGRDCARELTLGVTAISGARTGRGERSDRLSPPHAERVSHSDAARLLKPAFGPSKDILGDRIDAKGAAADA